MNHARLDYVAPVLPVADLERALAYYRDRLGFTLGFVHAGFYAGLERDGCHVHLKVAAGDPGREAQRLRDGQVDACFSVRDARCVAAQFEQRGALFAVPLRVMPYGIEFYLRDIDANVLAFVESVPA